MAQEDKILPHVRQELTYGKFNIMGPGDTRSQGISNHDID